MSFTSVLFLLGFMAGLGLAFVKHPIFGLITYVGVFYLHPPARWWGYALPDLRWSLLAAAITLLAVFVARKKPGPQRSRESVIIGLLVFVMWLGIQTPWALSRDLHLELLTLMAKYALLLVLMHKCIDSEQHLKVFVWSHVAGTCFLGWITFTEYLGGRFEGFGAPNIDEANAGALQIVTGIFAASGLLLAGKLTERAFLLGSIPLIVNAFVATMSRSGFLAAAFGGFVFNLFTPSRFRRRVRVLSILALVLFALLTNPIYWMRIASLKQLGEEVEGVDTGAGRIVLLTAQWHMFGQHPLGCGHRCTAVLSPAFLDDKHLTGIGENRARSSHSTPMSMLVEHGFPGALFYVLLIGWTSKALLKVRREHAGASGLVASLIPAVAAALGAITISDLFVDNIRLEVRFWFIGILLALMRMPVMHAQPAAESSRAVGFRRTPLPARDDSESRAGSP
ncbi:MAG: O-antigen ligase family protein [Gammaproteobacteria bacterium]